MEAGGWRMEAGGWRLEDGGWRLETEVTTWPRNSAALTGSLDGQPSQTIPWLPVSHKNYIIAVSLTGHISTCTGAGDGCHGSTQRFRQFLQQIWIMTVVVFTVSHPSWLIHLCDTGRNVNRQRNDLKFYSCYAESLSPTSFLTL